MSTKTNHIQSIDSYFHVYNRGASRGNIFFVERHFEYFQRKMEESIDHTKIEIIAYCLMPNHYHFILYQKDSGGISKFIKKLCDGYAKAINKELHRTGHLFEGKYKIKRIDKNEYILHLSRYIHLNPVRARLVFRADCWTYSSYQHYCHEQTRSIISPKIILSQFKNAESYKKFVEEYKSEDKIKICSMLFK